MENSIAIIGILLLFCFSGCSGNKTDGNQLDKASIEQSVQDCNNFIAPKLLHQEIMNIDQFLINGSVPLISDSLSFYNLFGEFPYASTIPNTYSYLRTLNKSDSLIRVYHFNGATIEASKSGAILVDFNFEINKDIVFNHSKINLKYDLSLNEVCDIFPESCKTIKIGGTLWSGSFALNLSNKPLDSKKLFLLFRNQKLVRMRIVSFNVW